MAASLEHTFISKIIESGDFRTAEKLKITEEFFFTPECREQFRYLWNHFYGKNTNGTIPSWQIVSQVFPSLTYIQTTDAVATLGEQLRLYKMRSQIQEFASQLYSNAGTNPWEALNSLKEKAATFSTQHDISDDLLLGDAYTALERDYQLVASGQGITGIPWPWEALNEETLGMHKGDFIIIFGRPGNGKTWFGLASAVHAYAAANKRVLIFSMEMKTIQVLRRCASILAGVDYDKFRKGKLNPADFDKIFGILQNLRDQEHRYSDGGSHQPAILVTSAKEDSGKGISALQAKIREFRPDVIIVDGMYLMRDDRQRVRTIDWKAIAHISQDLKGTAQTFDIPIIGITQANRSAAKNQKEADLSELAYADALAQDCDLCMRVHLQKDQATNESEMVINFPKSRETRLDAFVINYHPSTNFGFKRAIVGATQANNPQNQPQVQTPQAQRTVPVLPFNQWRTAP